MAILTYPELAERFYRGGIGLTEFLSLVDFNPGFNLSADDVSLASQANADRKNQMLNHVNDGLSEVEQKIAAAKSEQEKRKLLAEKDALTKYLAKASDNAIETPYDGSRFYKFFRIIRAEAKKITRLPGEKPEAHHQRIINHLAGIIPGMVTIKKTK